MTTLTLSEQATLSKLRAGTHVVVPVQALKWLHGEDHDGKGRWFSDYQDEVYQHAIKTGGITGSFWWRKPFRAMITASQGPDHD